MAERKKGKSHKDVVKMMGSDIFEAGSMYYDTIIYAQRGTMAVQYGFTSTGAAVASNATSALPWVFGGLLYSAQTGLNYRKLRKGQMTESQFKRSMRIGAYRLAGGIAGGTGGAAVGFAVGAFAGPVGAIVGTVVGGIYGGFKGQKFGHEHY